MTISISTQPTFDLEQNTLLKTDQKYAYIKSNEVFYFDGVVANVVNRSRVLRHDKEESMWIESIISATVDAGFIGYLFWKASLTPYAQEQLAQHHEDAHSVLRQLIDSSAQLQMQPSISGNYYNGSNQTKLKPNIIFNID